MASSSRKTDFNKIILGTAAAGAIGIAGLFLADHFREEKNRKQVVQGWNRFEQGVKEFMEDFEKEMCGEKAVSCTPSIAEGTFTPRTHRISRNNDVWSKSTPTPSTARHTFAPRNNISTPKYNVATRDDILSTENEYFTADDASSSECSDSEFRDALDYVYKEVLVEKKGYNLNQLLCGIDKKLDQADMNDIVRTLKELEDLRFKNPKSSDLLYRIGKAHHKLSQKTSDQHMTEDHIAKGIKVCTQALQLDATNAHVHKWYAILIGSRIVYQPLQDKVTDGILFKKHLDRALSLNRNDAYLYYMLGRYCYEISQISWWERSAAEMIFGSLPTSTCAEALEYLLKAENLGNFSLNSEFKENKLFIAKTKIAEGNYSDAAKWLKQANCCTKGVGSDEKINMEVRDLLQKYI